jgi:hypothetical protein
MEVHKRKVVQVLKVLKVKWEVRWEAKIGGEAGR